ncbi:MAG: GntR family transcriptional regulator, N-acetylglucosamine utilization regulator [Fusobacteriaceae bacterium]|jgi:GntR family transcriptional regulator|nr:transcriptional regulator [Fusobacteriales bacterium]MDN5305147.1 GntR family transcriptional regulator, N-acetylglucosamine utilization regulator [Fusobacteriaceae bacterium]
MGILTKDSIIPLYYQIIENIKNIIRDKNLKPGDSIPSERELSKKYDVSRMTVNKAISTLVDEGILYREKGKGTFVAEPKKQQELFYLKSFTEEMKEKGLSTSTEILEFKIENVTFELREKLKIDPKIERVIKIKRIRNVEKEPFALETAWIPLKYCPDLTKEKLEGESLYSILEKDYNLKPLYARQSINPIKVKKKEANLLKIKAGELALLFNRKTYIENDEIIEYTETINRTDKYSYEVILKHR